MSHFCHLTQKFNTFSILMNNIRNVFGAINYNLIKQILINCHELFYF